MEKIHRKENNMKKKILKTIKSLLALTLVLCLGFSHIPVHAMENTDEYTFTTDGVTYYMNSHQEDKKNIIELRTSDNSDFYTYIVDVENQTIECQTYQLNDAGSYDVFSKLIDTSVYSNNLDSQVSPLAIGYGSKVECKMGDYWYQSGSEGSKTYLKIGCKATYLIRTDNLSDAKYDRCESYKSNIRSCNSSYNKALAAVGGSSAVLGTIIGLVIANIAFPPSVIITAVISVFGSGAGYVAAANYAIDAQEYKDTAADIYITIRTYGTKQ